MPREERAWDRPPSIPFPTYQPRYSDVSTSPRSIIVPTIATAFHDLDTPQSDRNTDTSITASDSGTSDPLSRLPPTAASEHIGAEPIRIFRAVCKFRSSRSFFSKWALQYTIVRWVSAERKEVNVHWNVSRFGRLVCESKEDKVSALDLMSEFNLENIAVNGGCGFAATDVNRVLHGLRSENEDDFRDGIDIRIPDHTILAVEDKENLSSGTASLPSSQGTSSQSRSCRSESTSSQRSVTPSLRSTKGERNADEAIEPNAFCACSLVIENKRLGGNYVRALCQLLCYLHASFQMCASRLGLLVIGAGFSRLIVKNDKSIFIEVEEAEARHERRSILDFLTNHKSTGVLHRLGSKSVLIGIDPDETAIKRMYRIFRKGFECLIDLPETGVDRNVLLEHGCRLAEIWPVVEIRKDQELCTIIANHDARREVAVAKYTAIGKLFPRRSGRKAADAPIPGDALNDDTDNLDEGDVQGRKRKYDALGRGGASKRDRAEEESEQNDSGHRADQGRELGSSNKALEGGKAQNHMRSLARDNSRPISTSPGSQAARSHTYPTSSEEHSSSESSHDHSRHEQPVESPPYYFPDHDDEQDSRYIFKLDANFQVLFELGVGLIPVTPSAMDQLVESIRSASGQPRFHLNKALHDDSSPLNPYLDGHRNH